LKQTRYEIGQKKFITYNNNSLIFIKFTCVWFQFGFSLCCSFIEKHIQWKWILERKGNIADTYPLPFFTRFKRQHVSTQTNPLIQKKSIALRNFGANLLTLFCKLVRFRNMVIIVCKNETVYPSINSIQIYLIIIM
jgi:hypothetical protein